jgi:hypothetical protein
MTFVEQILPLCWGANLRVQRVQDYLFVTGDWLLAQSQDDNAGDLWKSYLAFPTDWSGNRPRQAPHIEFANANTDDRLVAFVERFGPVTSSAHGASFSEGFRIGAAQDLEELRDERILYSAALRLLSELQHPEKTDRDRIMNCMREIAAKTRTWPDQWERESQMRADRANAKPSWQFQQVDLKSIESLIASGEWALERTPLGAPDYAEAFAYQLSLGERVLCTLVNAFPTRLYPIGHGRVTELPDHDISYGIRPLLYHILRLLWLRGSIGICANERCRELFEVDKSPYCSDECSRKERQRQYWAKKGSAQRRRRKRIQEKTVPGKQKPTKRLRGTGKSRGKGVA